MPHRNPAVVVQHIKKIQPGRFKSNPLREVNARNSFSMLLHKMLNPVTQPGMTQTPPNCLEFTFFRGDQENHFTFKIGRLIQ